MKVLPDSLRDELSRPFGPILKDYSSLKGKTVVSVGDVSTLRLLDEGIKPWLAVCDGRSLRRPLPEEEVLRIRNAYNRVYEVDNPPGHLTDEAVRACEKGLQEGGLILVRGEEDLLALVIIMNLPDGWLCVYGQPGKGLVGVEGNEENRRKARDLYSRFTPGSHEF